MADFEQSVDLCTAAGPSLHWSRTASHGCRKALPTLGSCKVLTAGRLQTRLQPKLPQGPRASPKGVGGAGAVFLLWVPFHGLRDSFPCVPTAEVAAWRVSWKRKRPSLFKNGTPASYLLMVREGVNNKGIRFCHPWRVGGKGSGG